MPKPSLIVIAGCNGSGKSTFSHYQVKDITPFDFDKRLMQNYQLLPDSEFRDTFARDKTIKEFESSIRGAFSNNEDFCYETNFDSHPMYWISEAINFGYNVELHFYCLETRKLAEERVQIRTSNSGHYIPKDTIDYKWKEGYKNLNLFYQSFDYVYLIDNSKHLSEPKGLFSLTKIDENDYIIEIYEDTLPEYSERRFPDIFKRLKE